MGYIYLLQPAELVGTDRYKIGISSKDNLNRLRSYGCGTRYMFFMECDNYLFVENKLKEAFEKCGMLTRVKGREYYKGDEEIVMKEFFNIVFRYKIKEYVETNIPVVKTTVNSDIDLIAFSPREKTNLFKDKISKFKYLEDELSG